ncbi:L,D-transpeptidase family protein [Novosphingobium cyanobacteriorum]|uniref:L,D-transpeptidase family protein n=1 Tax=Novosphingobium cyanobacteriorum TaxID=3024215 RepID=A0ABT6CSD1_9SPHN|nr:L,D-transpeptidase family protein [Novosphingobium cyanobacteriorum]MDF8335642.1 L,D-transpeptidase family protein [Novosphingobium cyanobacteriorum]
MPRVLAPAAMLFLLVSSSGGAADLEPADSLLVEKAARRLTLLDAQGRVIRTFAGIQLGDEPVGPKHFEGDERTPEGRYVIDWGNPDSAYHLSLHISYPDSADRAFAAAHGRNPGGAIFIHGQPNGIAERPEGDWTDGCIALSNEEIEELWARVGDGTPIVIAP